MAAQAQGARFELVGLRRLHPALLEPLLHEEAGVWQADLHWDFRPAADLVRRYVAMQALDGVALLDGDAVAGYAYHVSEGHKGLIGDLFVRREQRGGDTERELLEGVLADILQAPGVRRIEAQLMLQTSAPAAARSAAGAGASFPRQFMLAALGRAPELAARRAGAPLSYEPWRAACLDDAAQLIAAAYSGHIDSQINDQYRSAGGARRFLQNIVQFPGCGQFLAHASWMAREARSGRLAGICLASRVSSVSGHITQVCVAPDFAGAGAGYELMRRAMGGLASEGLAEVSLTVTAANERAVALYERMGFATVRRFSASVWEGFR